MSFPLNLFGYEARFRRRTYDTPINCLVIIFPSLAICDGGLRDNRLPSLLERPGAGQDDPGNPGDLRGQRHDDLVDVHTGLKTVKPGPQPMTRSVEV